jgi:hypothetical protein
LPDLYAEDELDYFGAFLNPLLPLGYPVEGEEAEFHLALEAPEPESLIEEEGEL